MMAIQCSITKVTDYVNKAIDMVFKDDHELISLDPRKGSVDNDPRVKIIRGRLQLLLFSHQ